MQQKYKTKKNILWIGLIFLLPYVFFSCTNTQETTYNRLKAYIDSIKVINTHEHQRTFEQYSGEKCNFYSILAFTYLQSDLISAGAPMLTADDANIGDLGKLWETCGPYLNFCRNTSYYGHLLAGFRLLYGYNESYLTKEGIENLSQQIASNYSRLDDWYGEAFTIAGFELLLVDQYWDNFNMDLDSRYFALVFNINSIATALVNRTIEYRENTPAEQNFYKLAEKDGFSIKNLDDYLDYCNHIFHKFIDHGVVCVKNSMAYGRTLYYPYVSYEEAKRLFDGPLESLSEADKKALVDFMFHWIIQKCIEYDLPIQIHTGYLAGNGNVLENSHPLKLNNLFLSYPKAKFILFHGGFPWTGEYAAMGKMFPNVYLDLVWLPQISRERAVLSLDEMLDCVPYNKFFWGGDCHFIEESAGSLEFGRDVVAHVLTKRVERGLLTEDIAKDIALKIFRENAMTVFRFYGRLNPE